MYWIWVCAVNQYLGWSSLSHEFLHDNSSLTMSYKYDSGVLSEPCPSKLTISNWLSEVIIWAKLSVYSSSELPPMNIKLLCCAPPHPIAGRVYKGGLCAAKHCDVPLIRPTTTTIYGSEKPARLKIYCCSWCGWSQIWSVEVCEKMIWDNGCYPLDYRITFNLIGFLLFSQIS